MARQIATIRGSSKAGPSAEAGWAEYDPYKSISPEGADLLKQGKKIEAIKCYREEKRPAG